MAVKPRFTIEEHNGNYAVIDSKTNRPCPKLYKKTPAGDCVYPADDFASRESAQGFANKLNKEIRTKRYKAVIKAHPDADQQILIAAQY